MDILKLLMVVILIGLTAFLWLLNLQLLRYVAVVLIDSLAKRRGALAAKKVTTNLDEYLSACQLGITITALGLGWLGEPTIKHLLEPLFLKLQFSPTISSTVSFIIAFAVITFYMLSLGNLLQRHLLYKSRTS